MPRGTLFDIEELSNLTTTDLNNPTDLHDKLSAIKERIVASDKAKNVLAAPHTQLQLLAAEILEESSEFNTKLSDLGIAAVDSWEIYQLANASFFDQLASGEVVEEDNSIYLARLREAKKGVTELSSLQTELSHMQWLGKTSRLHQSSAKVLQAEIENFQTFVGKVDTSQPSLDLAATTQTIKMLQVVQKLRQVLESLKQPEDAVFHRQTQRELNTTLGLLENLDISANNFGSEIGQISDNLTAINELVNQAKELQTTITILKDTISTHKLSSGDVLYQLATTELSKAEFFMQQESLGIDSSAQLTAKKEELEGIIELIKQPDDSLKILMTRINELEAMNPQLKELRIYTGDNWPLLKEAQECVSLQLAKLSLGEKLDSEDIELIQAFDQQLEVAEQLITELYNFAKLKELIPANQEVQNYITAIVKEGRGVLYPIIDGRDVVEDVVIEVRQKLTTATEVINKISTTQSALDLLQKDIATEEETQLMQFVINMVAEQQKLLQQLKVDDPNIATALADIDTAIATSRKLIVAKSEDINALVEEISKLSQLANSQVMSKEVFGGIKGSLVRVLEQAEIRLVEAVSKDPIADVTKLTAELHSIDLLLAEGRKLPTTYNVTKSLFAEMQNLLTQFVEADQSSEQKIATSSDLRNKLQTTISSFVQVDTLQKFIQQLQQAKEKLSADLDQPELLNGVNKFLTTAKNSVSQKSFSTENAPIIATTIKQTGALTAFLNKLNDSFKSSTSLMTLLQQSATENEMQELFAIITQEFNDNDLQILRQSDELFKPLIENNFAFQSIEAQYKILEEASYKVHAAVRLAEKLESYQFFAKKEELTLATEKLSLALSNLTDEQQSWFKEEMAELLNRSEKLLGDFAQNNFAELEQLQPLIVDIHVATGLITDLESYPVLTSLAKEIAEFPGVIKKYLPETADLPVEEIPDVTSWQVFNDAKKLLHKRLTTQDDRQLLWNNDAYDYPQLNLRIIREVFAELGYLHNIDKLVSGAEEFSQYLDGVLKRRVDLLAELTEADEVLVEASNLANVEKLATAIQALKTLVDANVGEGKPLNILGDDLFSNILNVLADDSSELNLPVKDIVADMAFRITAANELLTPLAEDNPENLRDYQLAYLLGDIKDLTAEVQKFSDNAELSQILQESKKFMLRQLLGFASEQEQIAEYSEQLQAITTLVKEANNLRAVLQEIESPATEFAEKILTESKEVLAKISREEVAAEDILLVADKIRATEELLEQTKIAQATITETFNSTPDLQDFAVRFNAETQRQIDTQLSRLASYDVINKDNRNKQLDDIKNIQDKANKLQNIKYFREVVPGYNPDRGVYLEEEESSYNPARTLLENVYNLRHISEDLWSKDDSSEWLVLSEVENLYMQFLERDDDTVKDTLLSLEASYSASVQGAIVLATELKQLNAKQLPQDAKIHTLMQDVLKDGKKILLDPPLTMVGDKYHYLIEDAIENTQQARQILELTTELSEVIDANLNNSSSPFYGFAETLNKLQDSIVAEAMQMARQPALLMNDDYELSQEVIRRKTIKMLVEDLQHAVKVLQNPQDFSLFNELVMELNKSQQAHNELKNTGVDLTGLQQEITRGREILLKGFIGDYYYTGERDKYGWLVAEEVDELIKNFLPELVDARNLAEKLVLLKRGTKTTRLATVEKEFNKLPKKNDSIDQNLTQPSEAMVPKDKDTALTSKGGTQDPQVLAKCYEIFGLEDGASFAAIRKRYKQLVLAFHPDKNKGLGKEQFIIVQEAYELLLNQGDKFMQHKPLPLTAESTAVDIDSMSKVDFMRRTNLLGKELKQLFKDHKKPERLQEDSDIDKDLTQPSEAMVPKDKDTALTSKGGTQDPQVLAKCYEIFGLEYGASFADIRKRYKQLTLAFHPDKNRGMGGEQFVIMQEAYELLLNQGDEFMQRKPLPLTAESTAVDIDSMSKVDFMRRTNLLGKELKQLFKDHKKPERLQEDSDIDKDLTQPSEAMVPKDKDTALTSKGGTQDPQVLAKCYEIFGLEYGASFADIRKRYKQLTLAFHPDKNKGMGGEQFTILKEAYDFLLNQGSGFMQRKPLALMEDAPEIDITDMPKSDLFKRTGLLGGELQNLLKKHEVSSTTRDSAYVPPFLALESENMVTEKLENLRASGEDLLNEMDDCLRKKNLKQAPKIVKTTKKFSDGTTDVMKEQRYSLQKVVNSTHMLKELKPPIIDSMKASNKVMQNLPLVDKDLLFGEYEDDAWRLKTLEQLRFKLSILLSDLENYTNKVFLLFSRKDFDKFLSCFSYFKFIPRGLPRVI